jgi:endonuclease/exonuclease/phosphatase family metal-dependent hydrolase
VSLAPARRGRWEIVLAVVVALVAIGAWAVVASRPGLVPTGCPEDCAAGSAGRRPGPLRVVQLNMLHGFPAFEHLPQRIDLIAAQIAKLDPDVVLLQEVPWTVGTGSVGETLAHRVAMNHVGLRANGNRRAILFEEGEEILSRFPMRDVASAELPWGDDFFEHRVALRATLQTPWGSLRVVSTHLAGKPPKVSEAQTAALRAFVGAPAEVTVIGGDFNAHEDTPPLRDLARNWTDVLRAGQPPDPGLTCCVDDVTAAPGSPLQERIDYLWLAGGTSSARVVVARRILIEPEAVGGGWLRASDHVGLYAELELAP